MPLKFESISTNHVMFHVKHRSGIITLNRPQALNALDIDMMIALRHQLLAWMSDPHVDMIIVHSDSSRAFCAGGDLRSLYEARQRNDFNFLENIFRQEYALNYLIREYPKPYVSLINGIVMGGGIGLSVHGDYRILGDHVTAAMPETNLGYFPDVGASLFLNEPPENTGLYIALCGLHLNTADALYCGIGTHYVTSHQHQALMEDLIHLSLKTPENIEEVIYKYHLPAPTTGTLQQYQQEIKTHFAGNSVDEIVENLTQDESSFAKETSALLSKRCPASLKVTFEQLRRGKRMSMAEAMKMEFVLSQNFVHGLNFFEGIRAAIIDKDKEPHWIPPTITDVSNEFVLKHFESTLPSLELDEILYTTH